MPMNKAGFSGMVAGMRYTAQQGAGILPLAYRGEVLLGYHISIVHI
jgi:hypothetical protein